MPVTIVMPVYNAMPYLRAAVASILSQSYPDLTLVAVDDGSTDDSLAYLQSIDDPRLTILQTGGRKGQGAARNLVISSCSTEYLAFADADDISLPQRLDRQIAHMDLHPEIGMLGTQFSFIGPSGRLGPSPPLALEHEAIRRDLMLCRHAVANCTLMFRTSVIKRSGGFRIEGAGEDVDLFLRMTEQTRVANLQEVLCHYRVHSTSTNATQAQVLLDRYAHACECAMLRQKSHPETDFFEFCARQRKRSPWKRLIEQMDLVSGLQYRAAIVALVEGQRIRAYRKFFLAALISPRRVLQRLAREVRSRVASWRE